MSRLFVVLSFLLVVQVGKAQNWVVNPYFGEYEGSNPCHIHDLFKKETGGGFNAYERFKNSMTGYKGWKYGHAYIRSGLQGECYPTHSLFRNFKLNPYGVLNDTVINLVKQGKAYYGSRALRLYNELYMSHMSHISGNDTIDKELFLDYDNIMRSFVIGSLEQNLALGKKYYFSVWLSPEYNNYHDLYDYTRERKQDCPQVSADFGLMLWDEKTYALYDSIMQEFFKYDGFIVHHFYRRRAPLDPDSLWFNHPQLQELAALNPVYNIIDGNADSNWTELGFHIEASSEARYFVFGMFPKSLNRPVSLKNNSYFNYMQKECIPNQKNSHYYADAFTLMPYPELGDTLYLAAGDSLVLDPQTPSADLEWFNGGKEMQQTVYCPGRYWVRSKTQFTQLTDQVWVLPKEVVAEKLVFCHAETELRISEKASEIQWSTGATSHRIIPPQAGEYTVSFNMPGGCSFTKSFKVRYENLDLPQLTKDTLVCQELKLSFSPKNGQYYRWSTGDTTTNISLNQSGDYHLEVSTDHCSTQVYFSVNIENRFALNSRDTILCEGETFYLSPTLPYAWQVDGGENKEGYTDSADLHLFWEQKACGRVSDTFKLRYKYCDCLAHIPNAISPNGDGLNEAFIPQINCETKNYELRLYNRWGQLIFTTHQQEAGWPAGQVPLGVYYYTLSYQTLPHGRHRYHHGTIQVVY